MLIERFLERKRDGNTLFYSALVTLYLHHEIPLLKFNILGFCVLLIVGTCVVGITSYK